MMVASIGMQFFNNYANNKKSKEVQAQQREFQKAAAAHDFDRMRKAQAAAAKLALELEADVHKERLEDIERSYETLLENFAHSFAISNWPLNVLPFIMKGESFGTLFGGSSKSISMHCILTPSNCQWFNEYFYDDLDLRVEAEMNNNWNAQSSHPIVYYGGGWNRRQNKPNGTSIPSLIDLDDIALLKNKLKQIPTMTITPYFDPYLHFRVQLWGMGKDSEIPFRIDIPHGEIEAKTRIFSYDYYKDDQQELTDDFFNTTMEEFVPYVTSLIGFVADKYFWSMYGTLPVMHFSLINSNNIMTNKLLSNYRKMYEIEIKEGNHIIRRGGNHVGNFADYIKTFDTFYTVQSIKDKMNELLSSYCYKYSGSDKLEDLAEVCNHGGIIRSDIDNILFCLISSEDNQEKEKLITSLYRIKQDADRVLFCYHAPEVYATILDELSDLQYANIRIVDAHILFVAVYKLKTLISFNVFIVHKGINNTNGIYRIKKNEFKAIKTKDVFLEKIPVNILPNSVRDNLTRYNQIYKDMLNLFSQIHNAYTSVFDNVKQHKLSYSEIIQWSKVNYKRGDSLTILRLLHNDFYYIIGYLAPVNTPSLERCIIAKSYSVDKSILDIMKDKIIFVQHFN